MSEELNERLEELTDIRSRHDYSVSDFCKGCEDALHRIRDLETLVSRLPHVWHRREREWVRVAVVPGMDYAYHGDFAFESDAPEAEPLPMVIVPRWVVVEWRSPREVEELPEDCLWFVDEHIRDGDGCSTLDITMPAHDCYLTRADALHAQHDPPKENL